MSAPRKRKLVVAREFDPSRWAHVAFFIGFLLLAYVLSKHTDLGVQGIWWAFPATNVAIALVTYAVSAKGDWKKKRLLDDEEVLTAKVSDEILSGERSR